MGAWPGGGCISEYKGEDDEYMQRCHVMDLHSLQHQEQRRGLEVDAGPGPEATLLLRVLCHCWCPCSRARRGS